MPTQAESDVLRMLSAIEIDPEQTAKAIEENGNEAVTVLCDVALGTFPGLRPKVRMNAVALLGWMTHIQAKETMRLLVRDPSADISIRALRATARHRDDAVVRDLGTLLQKQTLPALVAVEAVKALIAINSSDAQTILQDYDSADRQRLPHRAAEVVEKRLRERQ